MARKFKLFGREIIIGKRLVGVGKDDQYIGAVDFGTDTRTFRRLDAYRGIVYACINRVADSYASYEPYIERISGKEKTVLADHEFLKLLRRPSGTDDKAVPYTLFDLLFATAVLIELQADAYWYVPVGENTKKPKEIILLRADKVGRELDDQGEITSFFVRVNGSKVEIPIYEMIPFIGFNPKEPYRGLGTTEAGADYVETEVFSAKFTKNFFKNNAGISGILTFAGELTKGAFKKAVRLWRERYQGVENAGKVMMVRNSEATFTKVGLGLDELDMAALRQMSREDIGLMYGVPLSLLGKSEESGMGRANIEALEYTFAKYTIEPKLKRLDSILQFALERYYKTTDLKICHQNIIPEDKEFELQMREKGTDMWITRNEIRRKDGNPEVEGGDKLRAPFNSLPIDEDIMGSSAADDSSKGLTIRIKRRVPADSKKKDSSDQVVKESFRLQLMRNQTLYEKRYGKKLDNVLTEQRKEALNNLEAHASAFATKDFNQKLFDDAAADIAMEKILMPVLKDLGETQGPLAMLFAGDDQGEFIMTAAYETLLRNSTQKMAKNYNDETLEALNRTLAVGIQAGENLTELKKRVEEVYAGAKGYRAERVARTETLKASNSATNEAYRQTGYVKQKEWLVNPGACEQCDAFNGKVIDLDGTFIQQGEDYEDSGGNTHTNSYEDIEAPPLHPNCRCTIVPVR
jgi:HK97 family phage portal protein